MRRHGPDDRPALHTQHPYRRSLYLEFKSTKTNVNLDVVTGKVETVGKESAASLTLAEKRVNIQAEFQ